MEKPRKSTVSRLFQFRVSKLLLAIGIFSCVLGWYVQRAKEQKKAVAWVIENGGNVNYRNGNFSDLLHESSWPIQLVGIDFFAGVEKVSGLNSDTQDLSSLGGLLNLQVLDLSGTTVSDLSPLEKLKNLEYLDVSGTQVVDLEPVASLRNLKFLNLTDTKVCNIHGLEKLRKLSELDLVGTNIRSLEPLAGVSSLEALNLENSNELDIRPLASIANLERLFLTDANGDDLRVLESIRSLKQLSIFRLKATQIQIQSLRAKLSACEIELKELSF